ncbi:MAG: peptidoglycan editing factor PgeF [Holosporaceae bacterium]|nr:peptidoglycan editing factor PgeF [Holosporaceae bacterium]
MRIQSAKIVSEALNYGFFGRSGGKSNGCYALLNCSRFVGDDDELVKQNLNLVREELLADRLVTLNQVHSDRCIIVDDRTAVDSAADAMVSKAKGIAIGVLTADCAPVLLFDHKKGVIGAAHAGWKGAVTGVLGATVQKMTELGSDPADIVAAIGPCITVENYEIDEDFRHNFKGNDDCFHMINSKLHFNLPTYCCNRLTEAGLDKKNIDIMNIDTYSNQENYFSYRFANQHTSGVCGRCLSAICLR